MPPTGGFGLNTGVQDVQNLCWKLSAVLKGQAGPALLDTYHAERQPLGLLITQNALENSLSMGRTSRQDSAKLPRTEFLNEQGLIFGASYESSAVIPDGSQPPVEDRVTQYVPSARPGGRAPHAWLQRGGERISTIDLFGGRFALLTGAKGHGWLNGARHVASPSRPELVAQMIGGESDLADPDSAWRNLYGLDEDGAVLVRPDGYVCWRSPGDATEPAAVLVATFDRVLRAVPG
jgi:hypothetical protein